MSDDTADIDRLRKDWLDALEAAEMARQELVRCRMDVRWWKQQYEAQFRQAQIAIGEARALRERLGDPSEPKPTGTGAEGPHNHDQSGPAVAGQGGK